MPQPKKGGTDKKKPRAAKKNSATTRRPKRATSKSASSNTRRGRAPKPSGLECGYSGKIFSSRQEARWALFLDILAIDWDYEPCHYRLGAGLVYLPDFYLPRHGLWLEVKGAPFFNAEALGKIANGAAGPVPLPRRDPPYGSCAGVLVGGGMRPVKDDQHPVFVVAVPGASGWAAFQPHHLFETKTGYVFNPTNDKPVARAKATGKKPASKPVATTVEKILQPGHQPGLGSAYVNAAYNAAARATSNEAGYLVPPPEYVWVTERRRAGRPLPEGL